MDTEGWEGSHPPAKPKLMDRLRRELRARHYSRRTEQAYCLWVRRYLRFHGMRHPSELGEPEVNAFLTHLAVEGHVSASTQTQALSALLFLYRSSRSSGGGSTSAPGRKADTTCTRRSSSGP